jgi:hypothetical protein
VIFFTKFDLNFRENIPQHRIPHCLQLSKNRFENIFAASTNTSFKLNNDVDFKTNSIFL